MKDSIQQKAEAAKHQIQAYDATAAMERKNRAGVAL